MSDEAIKKRLSRAKLSAQELLQKSDYHVIPSDNRIFCFVASRFKEIRWIKIVLDNYSPFDIQCIKDFKVPFINCTKEIWIRKDDDSNFIITEIS